MNTRSLYFLVFIYTLESMNTRNIKIIKSGVEYCRQQTTIS